MRVDIVENDPQRLRIALRTNVPLYAAFGLLFVALGLVCIRLLAVDVRIVVEQQRLAYTNTCVVILDCGSFGTRDATAIALVDHEVEVRLPDGTRRLELPQSDGEEKAALSRHIQSAMQDPGASFRHREGAPIAGLLLGLVCIGGGVVILAAIQWVRLTADRRLGTLELERRLLLTPPMRRELRLTEIEAVRVVPFTLQTPRHIVTSYGVHLLLRRHGADETVRVTFLPMFTERAAADLARLIRGWLDRA